MSEDKGGEASAGSRPLYDALIGAWALEDAFTINPTTGETSLIFGWPRPYVGLLTYAPGGIMSAQLGVRPKTAIGGGGFKTLPPSDRLAYLDTYYAYFGRFEVDEAGAQVIHHVEASLDPTEVGATYMRPLKLDGDRLTLSTVEARFSPTGETVNRLVWRRL